MGWFRPYSISEESQFQAASVNSSSLEVVNCVAFFLFSSPPFSPGRRHTDHRSGWATEQSVGAWEGGPCLPGGRGQGSHSFSLNYQRPSTPALPPGISKVPQKCSQTSRGAHPGAILIQGPKLHPALSPHGDWSPQTTGNAGHENGKAKRSTALLLSPFPGSATCFCPLDWMDHSVFTANLGDQGRAWQWKGTQPWDGVGLWLPLPWMQDTLSQRFCEMMFIVFKSSSLELDSNHSCLSVNWLTPLSCKLKKKKSKLKLYEPHPHWTCTKRLTIPFPQIMAYVTFFSGDFPKSSYLQNITLKI